MDLKNIKKAKLTLYQKGRGKRPIEIDLGRVDNIKISHSNDLNVDYCSAQGVYKVFTEVFIERVDQVSSKMKGLIYGLYKERRS